MAKSVSKKTEDEVEVVTSDEVCNDEIDDNTETKPKTKVKSKTKTSDNSDENTSEDTEKVRISKDIALNEYVNVRSVTQGTLSYTDNRTSFKYTWNGYGSKQLMTYETILAMNASYPLYFTSPYVVIDDKDVVSNLNFDYIYEEFDFDVIDKLEKFFELTTSEIQEKLSKLPKHIKDNLKVKARELHTKGTLTDLNKIRLLENELNIDLMILSD